MLLYFRFLSNVVSSTTITLEDNRKNRTKLLVTTDDTSQKTIEKGKYDVLVNGIVVLEDFHFKAGAVYTINVFETNNGTYVSVLM